MLRRLLNSGAIVTVGALAILLAACGGSGTVQISPTATRVQETGGAIHAAPVEDYPYEVQMFEDEAPPIGDPARHVADADYLTDPPTSGPHAGQLVASGVYDQEIADEILVHHMEHGYVIAWYNCESAPRLDDADCNSLRNNLAAVVQPALASGELVIAVPDLSMPNRLALTAWQFMDAIDEFDKERVETFIETFQCHYDPEGTCG
jgi:hypothetical protein